MDAVFLRPVCVMLQYCSAADELVRWWHFAELWALFGPCTITHDCGVWVTVAPLVQSTLFCPPLVAICSTRVEVVQFQPLPGQFGPA